MYKTLSGVVLIGLLLSGCSENNPEEAKKTEVAPVTKEVEKKEPEPIVEDNSEEINAYKSGLAESLGMVNAALEKFSDLSYEASDNPYVMTTDSWIQDTAVVLTYLDLAIDKAYALDPPEELKGVHTEIISSMDNYKFVVDNYPSAIDNMDFDLLDECIAHMQDGSYYMQRATEEMEKLK